MLTLLLNRASGGWFVEVIDTTPGPDSMVVSVASQHVDGDEEAARAVGEAMLADAKGADG